MPWMFTPSFPHMINYWKYWTKNNLNWVIVFCCWMVLRQSSEVSLSSQACRHMFRCAQCCLRQSSRSMCKKKRKRYDALCILVCGLHGNGGYQSHICTSTSIFCFVLIVLFWGACYIHWPSVYPSSIVQSMIRVCSLRSSHVTQWGGLSFLFAPKHHDIGYWHTAFALSA